MHVRVYYKLLLSRIISKWLVLSMDILIVLFSLLVAYLVRFSFTLPTFGLKELVYLMLATVTICTLFFHLTHTYIGVLRYSSFIDISRIFLALTLSYGVVAGGILFCYHFNDGKFNFSGSMLLVAYVINFALMSFSRIVAKLLFEAVSFDREHSVNVFVFGIQESGINIAKSLRSGRNNRYRLCGFITDEPELVDKHLMGHRVYANDEYLLDVLARKNVETLIVSPGKLAEIKATDLVDQLISNNIHLLTVPPLSEWGSEQLDNVQIKGIQIEDLLQREPIRVDTRRIASRIEGKRVLITGAAGSIGSEIVRQVAAFNPYKLILVDQAETPLHDMRLELQEKWRDVDAETIVADISNPSRMDAIFREYAPQYIFHAAAYKHVPMMEDNVSESIQTNVLGTRILADLAVKYHAETFVMISTDKAVNPTNVMGCSKRIAEIYVQSLAKKIEKEGNHSVKFITTRFGNVLGSNGSVIPRFRKQIAKGGPVTVTHPDILRYFMTIPEACSLVLEAGSMGQGGEIYLFDMGNPIKIVDLARRMIYLSGRKNIRIEYTGLRHGEKLYEELLNNKEFTHPTYHEKIMVANVREYAYRKVCNCIDQLIVCSYSYNSMEIVSVMKELVPEFISKNSEFEILDTKRIGEVKKSENVSDFIS